MVSLVAHKFIAVGLMTVITFAAGIVPIPLLNCLRQRAASSVTRKRWPSLTLCLLTCFSAGVFLGSCFLHLLPETLEQFEKLKFVMDWTSVTYPFSGLLVILGFLLIWFLEELFLIVLPHSHSHSGSDDTVLAIDRNHSSCCGHSPPPIADGTVDAAEKTTNLDGDDFGESRAALLASCHGQNGHKTKQKHEHNHHEHNHHESPPCNGGTPVIDAASANPTLVADDVTFLPITSNSTQSQTPNHNSVRHGSFTATANVNSNGNRRIGEQQPVSAVTSRPASPEEKPESEMRSHSPLWQHCGDHMKSLPRKFNTRPYERLETSEADKSPESDQNGNKSQASAENGAWRRALSLNWIAENANKRRRPLCADHRCDKRYGAVSTFGNLPDLKEDEEFLPPGSVLAEPECCELDTCQGVDEAPPILMQSRPHAHSHGVRSIAFVAAVALHSVVEGLALGVQADAASTWTMWGALMVHKVIVAFRAWDCPLMSTCCYPNSKIAGLGITLLNFSSVGLQLGRTHAHALNWVAGAVAFLAVTSPLGALIGIALQNSTSINPQAKEFVVFAMQGAAVGTFLYVTFFEVLLHERDNEHPNLLKVLMVALGVALLAGLRAAVPHHGHSHFGTEPNSTTVHGSEANATELIGSVAKKLVGAVVQGGGHGHSHDGGEHDGHEH